ncbi:MAG TPA: hypothetical protein VFV34_26080 [Blastocatellia bacterium]|nr:hypothetical protein [Blastocatellia bacterium]
MADRKRIAALVTAKIKKLDPESIVQGTFYDDASSRLIVTIIKGTRKILTSLPARWFEESSSEHIDVALKTAVKRLEQTPIG